MNALSPANGNSLQRGHAAGRATALHPCAFDSPDNEAKASAKAPSSLPVRMTLVKSSGTKTESAIDPIPVVQELAPYAALSANIHFATTGNRRLTSPSTTRVIAYRLHLPSGWRKNRELGSDPSASAAGLHFEVWESMAPSGTAAGLVPTEVCIVFRGTLWWHFDDWRLNFHLGHWLEIFHTLRGHFRIARWRPFGNDAFDMVSGEGERIFEFYRHRYPYHAIAFTSTGNALGGGLAQCLLYAHPARIRRAYAFNPSLVDGFHGQPAATRYQAYCDCAGSPPMPRIVRVYAHGWMRQRLGGMLTRFFPPGPHVHEVFFEFGQRWSLVAQRTLPSLAANILRLAGLMPLHAERRRRQPGDPAINAW